MRIGNMVMIAALALGSLVSLASLAYAAPNDSAATGPMVITQGGTYSGLVVQGTASSPAITITTTDPVTLTGCQISFKADGVECTKTGAQVQITNCTFTGQNPGIAGKFTQCAVD